MNNLEKQALGTQVGMVEEGEPHGEAEGEGKGGGGGERLPSPQPPLLEMVKESLLPSSLLLPRLGQIIDRSHIISHHHHHHRDI